MKGRLDLSTITDAWKVKQAPNIESSKPEAKRPPLEAVINLYDFEEAVQKALSAKSWAFMTAAANDSLTKDVLVAQDLVPAKSSSWRQGCRYQLYFMGEKFSIPVFNSPAVLAKLTSRNLQWRQRLNYHRM